MFAMLTGLLAAGNISLGAPSEFSSLNDITFPSIVSALVVLVLIVAALVFFFMLVLGGIRYITSGGDKGSTEAARSQITAALIGLVIVFSAWAIINIIKLFFGVDILSLKILPAAGNGAALP